MGQSKWNEEKIIQTLREFPKVEDSRSKEELFDQIQNKMGQEETEKKSKPFRFMPVLAAACILAIAAIISPTIMDQFDLPKDGVSQENESALSTSTKSPNEKDTPTSEQVEPAGPTEEAPDTSEVVPFAQVEEEYKYHVGITEIPEDKQVVTAYYPDQEAMGVVPVSFLAEKGLSRVEALEEALSTISDEELGLSESGLSSVNLSENPNANTLVLDIKPGSIQGSTGERIFVQTVQNTAFSLGYETIAFMSAGKPGYEFSHFGPMESMEVSAPEKGVSALLTNTGTLLLVNGLQLNGNVEPETLEDALHWMSKDMEGFGYQETIPENVFFKEISEDGKKVTIEFSEGTTLEDNMKYVAMLESILMAAHQFGYEQVDFINAPIEQIGPYHLSGTLPVLKAPNVIRP